MVVIDNTPSMLVEDRMKARFFLPWPELPLHPLLSSLLSPYPNVRQIVHLFFYFSWVED